MSLDRFSNKEEILNVKGATTGIVWKTDYLKFLNLNEFAITPEGDVAIEYRLCH